MTSRPRARPSRGASSACPSTSDRPVRFAPAVPCPPTGRAPPSNRQQEARARPQAPGPAGAGPIDDVLAEADIPCWADKDYRGASGPIRVPYRGKWHNLSPGQQAVNRSHPRIRALGERAVSTLKTWRPLRGLRCSTTRITDLTRAVLALHLATG
ncbi:hypothetical protein KCV87_00675 [Actinosynnema pretiosum subsp. pretiosum]|uniref:DDE Tnp4 domain-containing protein n=1 Tax=Actinosynnema pretiosum subsp. pretiosum TaxID=103721 RepID=A0AA45L8E8_9PSEU|nr:IS493-like transposase [Actinosynnema pretiosum subsp. pretiosum]QUF04693.1 hypothetical protein KCV87_00675 [Actinosynnema pretiosum subsp. pretiosum]